MNQVYGLPKGCTNKTHSYCPGCMHGVAMNILMHTIEKFELLDKIVIVNPVGCGGLGLYEATANYASAAHGRAAAVATGIKRCSKDTFVVTYQGDGDLAGIGIAETIYAAARGENITVIFANNTTYGMTGGQMAPTTMPGQKTSTSPYGRDIANDGRPFKMAELLSNLDGVAYAARVAVNSPKNVLQAKKVIMNAFQYQVEGKGLSFIEVLAACPTNWGMNALKANERVGSEMIPYFPLGVFKNNENL